MKKFLLVALMGAATACGGGGSGVSSSKLFKDLTPTEASDECHYLLDTYPQRTITCTTSTGTATVHLGFPADACADTTIDVPATCTATVGDLEDCEDYAYSFSDADVCSQVNGTTQTTPPASCMAIDADSCQSPSARTDATIDMLTHDAATISQR